MIGPSGKEASTGRRRRSGRLEPRRRCSNGSRPRYRDNLESRSMTLVPVGEMEMLSLLLSTASAQVIRLEL